VWRKGVGVGWWRVEPGFVEAYMLVVSSQELMVEFLREEEKYFLFLSVSSTSASSCTFPDAT
jgi:hypothetical protein